MDRESRRRWELHTKVKETMLERTHIPEARWWAVEAVDRKQARLNCIRPLLTQVPCGAIEHESIVWPNRACHPDYLRPPVPESMWVPYVYRGSRRARLR